MALPNSDAIGIQQMCFVFRKKSECKIICLYASVMHTWNGKTPNCHPVTDGSCWLLNFVIFICRRMTNSLILSKQGHISSLKTKLVFNFCYVVCRQSSCLFNSGD